MDFILNGNATGSVAERLLASNFDVNALRPYIGADGRAYITTTNAAGKLVAQPIHTNSATLRKDDWILLDTAIIKTAKARLKAVADLRGAGLEMNIPNGMGKTVLQSQNMSDITDAEITMDGLEKSKADRPNFELVNLPLPILHKDFSFSAREVNVSRNGGSPLDTTMAELAGDKVAEIAEKLLIGTQAGLTFGGGTIYGYTNFPSRLTKTITAPTASGWTAATTVTEVLEMIKQSQDAFHYGPYQVYYGPSWMPYMNDEYKLQSDDMLAERLRRIDNIRGVSQLDYLTGFSILVVQFTSNVVREVVGMDITTVQWATEGGMKLNFKVMAILTPQLRADQSGNTGIVHGSTT